MFFAFLKKDAVKLHICLYMKIIFSNNYNNDDNNNNYNMNLMLFDKVA